MALPHIEGTDDIPQARSGQMDIDRRAVDGTMTQMLLNHQEISPLLVEMGGKGMPEGMALRVARDLTFALVFGGCVREAYRRSKPQAAPPALRNPQHKGPTSA